MMKEKIVILLVVLLLLPILVDAQSGGRRKRGRSQGKHKGLFSSGDDEDKKELTEEEKKTEAKKAEIKLLKQIIRKIYQQINGKQKNKDFQAHYYKYQQIYQSPLLFFFIILLIRICSYFFDLKKQNKRYNLLKRYEQTVCTSPNRLSQEETRKFLTNFSSLSYTMTIKPKNEKQFPFLSTIDGIKIAQISRQQANAFDVHMNGKDSIGKSQLSGRLILTGEGVEMKLFKQYKDKVRARMNASFSQLLFEGFTNDYENWSGTWAYIENETSPFYLGTWILAPIRQ